MRTWTLAAFVLGLISLTTGETHAYDDRFPTTTYVCNGGDDAIWVAVYGEFIAGSESIRGWFKIEPGGGWGRNSCQRVGPGRRSDFWLAFFYKPDEGGKERRAYFQPEVAGEGLIGIWQSPRIQSSMFWRCVHHTDAFDVRPHDPKEEPRSPCSAAKGYIAAPFTVRVIPDPDHRADVTVTVSPGRIIAYEDDLLKVAKPSSPPPPPPAPKEFKVIGLLPSGETLLRGDDGGTYLRDRKTKVDPKLSAAFFTSARDRGYTRHHARSRAAIAAFNRALAGSRCVVGMARYEYGQEDAWLDGNDVLHIRGLFTFVNAIPVMALDLDGARVNSKPFKSIGCAEVRVPCVGKKPCITSAPVNPHSSPRSGWSPLLTEDRVPAALAALRELRLAYSDPPSGFAQAAAAYRRQDYAAAYPLFQTLAQQGHATAQAYMGTIHSRGHGVVPIDERQAAEWFRRAAAQGDGPAQVELSSLLREGKGVQKDPVAGMKLLREAAEAGYGVAQLGLALGYWYDEQTAKGASEKSTVLAYKWGLLAATQTEVGPGVGPVLDLAAFLEAFLDNLRKDLRPEEIARAEEMVRAWRPK